jgi:CRISPR/Cas system-associated exonuclease Cas4 (RecB family)
MSVPDGFVFSQSSLQDYLDCPRRFELRYLDRLVWPAVTAEPAAELERHLADGERFHLLVQQYFAGVDPQILDPLAERQGLGEWWTAFREHPVRDLPERRFVEVSLQTQVGRYRLAAKFDLLAFDADGRAVIVDWKTSRQRPLRNASMQRAQTLVYPLVLADAGHALTGGDKLSPDRITMIYWFAAYPQQPEVLYYSQPQYEGDRQRLADLLAEIDARTVFDKTTDERHCRFCSYRSLCGRGTRAGDAAAFDIEALADEVPRMLSADEFDLDQLAGIDF